MNDSNEFLPRSSTHNALPVINDIATISQEFGPHYERAARWLLKSFQVNDYRGSSAWQSRFFHPVIGWSHPYPETTGYIIPTIYDYLKWRSDRDGLFHRAITTSIEWLLSLQLPSGAFPGGHYVNAESYRLSTMDYLLCRASQPRASVFNSGQILRGLLRHYNETQDKRCYDSIVTCCNFLANSINDNGGWIADAYENNASPSYFTYVVPPLLEAYSITKNERILSRSCLALGLVSQQVNNETSFVGRMGVGGRNSAHTHTIAYTLQGLLDSARSLGAQGSRYWAIASNALSAILRAAEVNKRMPGGFSEGWKADWSYRCITGDFQLALSFLDLYDATTDPTYLNAASRIFLSGVTIQRRDGGFPGSIPYLGPYMRLRKPNWAAKYFMDLISRLRFIL